jgi:hypothetical protein
MFFNPQSDHNNIGRCVIYFKDLFTDKLLKHFTL